MSQVEELEKELKSYKEGRRTSLNNSQDGSEFNQTSNEEIRRLKAENIVLQKKLSGKTKISKKKNNSIIYFQIELSSKVVESISTASSSNESFQKEDIEIECEDNRYLSYFLHQLYRILTTG